jgi:putative transposase
MRGYPSLFVGDNGAQLTSNAVLKWRDGRPVEWRCIARGKPIQITFGESFNARLRGECLNEQSSRPCTKPAV